MGQQQILLIVLSVILVGISIAVGITMFKAYALSSNKDSMVLDIINIGSLTYQHRIKPSMLGGGNGTFEKFNPEPGLLKNGNGTYVIEISEDYKEIKITGTSSMYPATISVRYGLNLEIV